MNNKSCIIRKSSYRFAVANVVCMPYVASELAIFNYYNQPIELLLPNKKTIIKNSSAKIEIYLQNIIFFEHLDVNLDF